MYVDALKSFFKHMNMTRIIFSFRLFIFHSDILSSSHPLIVEAANFCGLNRFVVNTFCFTKWRRQVLSLTYCIMSHYSLKTMFKDRKSLF